MPEVAAVAWVVFSAVCVIGRFWYQRRLTADFGLRGLSGRVGSLAWWGGAMVSLSFVTLGAVPLLELAGVLARSRVPGWQGLAGGALMAAGTALTSTAQIQMGPSWRVGVRHGERTELVTHGVFGVVRNPIFAGVILVAAGGALLVPRVETGLALAAAIAGIQIQVRRVEEPHLRAIHGTAFEAYAERVGRFLPALGSRFTAVSRRRR
jgi:protein-S-isoprenylcysteine O-methyltransferase Ste14